MRNKFAFPQTPHIRIFIIVGARVWLAAPHVAQRERCFCLIDSVPSRSFIRTGWLLLLLLHTAWMLLFLGEEWDVADDDRRRLWWPWCDDAFFFDGDETFFCWCVSRCSVSGAIKFVVEAWG